ncbi:MAG: hypothetical protein WA991_00510 [Ornithinimicrobium sp.]
MIDPDSVGIPHDPAVDAALAPWQKGVFVVNQRSKPAIEAPLCWVLSDASRADMDSSIEEDRLGLLINSRVKSPRKKAIRRTTSLGTAGSTTSSPR